MKTSVAAIAIGATVMLSTIAAPTYALNQEESCAQVYQTTGDKQQLMTRVSDACGSIGETNVDISVDTSSLGQTIDGFGAAMTHSAATTLKGMDSQLRADALEDLFSTETGAGFTMLRVPIGSSDFPGITHGEQIHYTLADSSFVADLGSPVDVNGMVYSFGHEQGDLTLQFEDATKRIDVELANIVVVNGEAKLFVEGDVIGTSNNDVFLRVRTEGESYDVDNSMAEEGKALFEFDLAQLSTPGVWYDLVQYVRSNGYNKDLSPEIADMGNKITVGNRRYSFQTWNGLLKVSYENVASDVEITQINLVDISAKPILQVRGNSTSNEEIQLRVGGEDGVFAQNNSSIPGEFLLEADLSSLGEEGKWYDLHLGIGSTFTNLLESDPVNMSQKLEIGSRTYSFAEWNKDLKVTFSNKSQTAQIMSDSVEERIDGDDLFSISSAVVGQEDGKAVLTVMGQKQASVDKEVSLRLKSDDDVVVVSNQSVDPNGLEFRVDLGSLRNGLAPYLVQIGLSDRNQWDGITVAKADPQLESFSIENDKESLIPMIKAALEVNPDLTIIGTAWSAPAWMKESLSLYDGSLAEEWEESYADYLVKTVEAYAKEGIEIAYLSIVNEPLIEGPRNYPIMQMDARQQARVITILGPKLTEAGFADVKVLAYDHNYGETVAETARNYIDTVLGDQEASEYTAGVAFHGYEMGSVADFGPGFNYVATTYPGKKALVTEITEHMGSTIFADNLMWSAQNIVIGPLAYSSTGAMYWNLVLHDDGTPFFGGAGDSLGVISVANDESSYSLSSAYYSMAQVSTFLKGDQQARAVRTSVDNAGVYSQAIKGSDGGVVIPLVNNSGAEIGDLKVAIDGVVYTLDVPVNSVSTLVVRESEEPEANGTNSSGSSSEDPEDNEAIIKNDDTLAATGASVGLLVFLGVSLITTGLLVRKVRARV